MVTIVKDHIMLPSSHWTLTVRSLNNGLRTRKVLPSSCDKDVLFVELSSVVVEPLGKAQSIEKSLEIVADGSPGTYVENGQVLTMC
jgi:hypothetical protein